MNKRSRVYKTLTACALVLLFARYSYGGQEQVEVCHITEDLGGELVGVVITIADPAYQTHIEHGDPAIWNQAPELGPDTCVTPSEDACTLWTFQELADIATVCEGYEVDWCELSQDVGGSSLPGGPYEIFGLDHYSRITCWLDERQTVLGNASIDIERVYDLPDCPGEWKYQGWIVLDSPTGGILREVGLCETDEPGVIQACMKELEAEIIPRRRCYDF